MNYGQLEKHTLSNAYKENGDKDALGELFRRDPSKIDDSKRDILHLHFSGLSHRQIAEKYGISKGTARQRIKRAIFALEKELDIYSAEKRNEKEEETEEIKRKLAMLERAGRRINPKQRESLDLFYNQNLTHKECGDLLGISPEAARLRVYRARKAIQYNLELLLSQS
jgi:DNA-directed RNA polymerase specialized sigma24 family protein